HARQLAAGAGEVRVDAVRAPHVVAVFEETRGRLARQRGAVPGVPRHQLGRSVRIILEQKGIYTVRTALAATLEAALHPRADTLAVGALSRAPLGLGEDRPHQARNGHRAHPNAPAPARGPAAAPVPCLAVRTSAAAGASAAPTSAR